MKAKDLMTDGVLVIPENYSITDVINFFFENKISGAPVVSTFGKAIGVVTMTDIVKYKNEEEETDNDYPFIEYYNEFIGREFTDDDIQVLHGAEKIYKSVLDIMTPTVFQVDIDDGYKDIAKQMVDKKIHRVFVSEDGQLVGIVSSMDVLKVIC